jgi:hypothetical protein
MIDGVLDILRDQRSSLVRAELVAADERTVLLRGAVEAIRKYRLDISNVAEATSLSVSEIERALDTLPVMDEDVAAIAGLR